MPATSTPLGKRLNSAAGARKLRSRAPLDEKRRLEVQAADLQSQLTRLETRNRTLRLITAGGAAIAAVAGIAMGLISSSRATVTPSFIERLVELSRSPLGATLLGVVLASFFAIQASHVSARGRIEADLELLAAKARIASELPATTMENDQPQQSYFDSLVKINVDNLAEYYSLVKVHTNNSFRASLGVGLIGFLLIMIGVLAGFGGEATATPAKVAAASGVITEFISGVFFYLYNRTVRQLKEYHDSLLAVQNILLSFKLVNETEDPSARRDMTSQMCSFLLAGSGFPALRSSRVSEPADSGSQKEPA